MKKIILSGLIALSFCLKAESQNIPLANRTIIEYVNGVMGQKVKRGECWDLAAEALNRCGCKWDGAYRFGQQVNPNSDTIFPGDIIQFSNVTLKYTRDGLTYKESMKHHTAIVYEVKAKGVYRIAHQNTGFSGRKVGVSDLRLLDVTSGKLIFYRPVSP